MENINFNELKERAYRIACNHGFHDDDHSEFHFMMLVVTEIGESVNSERNDNYANRVMFEKNFDTPNINPELHWRSCFEVFIKDTVEDELADAAIRLLDLAGTLKYDIDSSEFEEKEYKIASKDILQGKTFTEQMFSFIFLINNGCNIRILLYMLFAIAYHNKIDLLWYIEQKMKYNEMRPYKHGNKY